VPDPTTPRTAPSVQLQLHPADDQHAALLGSVDAWAHTLRSDHTRRAYLGPVLRLLEQPAGFSAPGLQCLRDDLLADGRSARTVHRAMTAVISCAAWLIAHGHLAPATLQHLRGVSRPRRDPPQPGCPAPNGEQLTLPWASDLAAPLP